ncbi:hypothetical protein [Chromohalobacter marismortui]|uniref:hypothetical protein n=1 Tax=Chromohalobacter marismortui TaxID=42055 RepID=UPI00105B4502|nr:hypothetical protein [Chromohalobacter marismortui]
MTEKQRITVQLSSDLLNRLKNAVYWTPGMTLASAIDIAIEEKLFELEKDNHGAFEQRPEELKAGRPIK